jgi:tRNA dimethylallyltransferase
MVISQYWPLSPTIGWHKRAIGENGNKMSPKPSLIIISGPTGVGKTEMAIALAAPLGGEIISADAMQVYRHMDIGTAKPSKEQRASVRHHIIDVVDPDEPFSAARFKAMADEIILKLHEKKAPVFVVGGTGLYIKALTRGLFRVRGENQAIRQRLRTEVKSLGPEALHARLRKVDPEGAEKIHPHDTYRVIRALEVLESTGKPLSEHHKSHGFSDHPYRVFKIGLFMDREPLYRGINERAERMLASGFLEEVKGLLDRGYGPDLKSMRSIGYRHMTEYLQGNIQWDEALRLFKRDTRRYAKRQLTWFRADPEIQWFQPQETHTVREKTDAFLTRRPYQHS